MFDIGELHGEAMYGAMLAHDGAGVERQDVALGEGLRQNGECLLVVFPVAIGGTNHCAIDHKEIGIGGREPLLFVEERVGQGQFE